MFFLSHLTLVELLYKLVLFLTECVLHPGSELLLVLKQHIILWALFIINTIGAIRVLLVAAEELADHVVVVAGVVQPILSIHVLLLILVSGSALQAVRCIW